MDERTIAVVDGNSLVHRAFHALPPSMTAADGRPTNAVFGFAQMLVKLVGDMRPDGVVVAFDKGKPAFRTEVLERYKMHRPPTDPDLKAQFPMVKELLGALGVPIVELDGWEGDDVLGTLAEKGRSAGMRILLVTGDRDALQLVDETVHVVSTRKGVTDIIVYDPAAVLERYGVRPEQVPDYLGLKGDTSDNIPGVPGIGEKTAAKLIAEYGTLEAVLEAAPGIKGKLGQNLCDHTADAFASRDVATIRRDLPIDLDLEHVRWGAFDEQALPRVLNEFRFRSILDRLYSTVQGAPETGAPEMPQGAMWPVSEDPDGSASLRMIEAAGDAWLGVSLGQAQPDSLFAEATLALAFDGQAFRTPEEPAREVLLEALRRGRVVSGDVKGLLAEVCPPDVAGATCDLPLTWVEPSRLFDCSLAAYLLESNRSSYETQALFGEFVGARLAGADEEPVPADAQAALALMPLLRDRLAEDGSTECFERIEMPLVPVLARMENVGVGLDVPMLGALAAEMGVGIAALASEITELAGVDFNVDSPKQLGEVLFDKLGLPPGKRTKTGYSTDSSVLSALAPAHPICAKVLSYRELTKLKSTYVDALPRLLAADGRLHTTFNQTVAATGRLSSSNPNLQNIPVRTELGRRIRAAFVPAREGDLIVSADYSQIELRILAHLSEDPALIEAFTSGLDFHTATASRVFGVAPGSVDAEHRRRAKAVNFGIVYGISAHGLADKLGTSNAEAQATIDRYYSAYPKVREFLDRTIADAHRDGHATTLYGRRRRIPELASSNHNLRSFGERTAMNHPMQGTAADIMKLAMIETDRRLVSQGFRSRMVLQVHDELVFEASADELASLADLVSETMAGVAELHVPLVVNVASGHDWAAAK